MLKLKFTLLAVAFLFFVQGAFATAQYPDKIVYNGKNYSLHTNPLEEFFRKNPEKRPTTGIRSSALWRGYVATFEIVENGLYLKDVEIEVRKGGSADSFETEWKSFLKELVPDGKRLKLDWFTGLLILPHGKLVNYVHMGYGSTYENYVLIEIDRGDFKRAKEFTLEEYEKFKERQFAVFKKTVEYKKLADEMRRSDPNSTDEFIDSFLKKWVVSFLSKILVD